MPQNLADFEMVFDITSETYCDESETTALGTRHALQVLIQYFLYDPAISCVILCCSQMLSLHEFLTALLSDF